MQTHAYLVELSKPLDAALSTLKSEWSGEGRGRAALLAQGEFGLLPRLIEYSFLVAFKSFQLGTARARTLELEWLRTLAATRSIERAIDFTRPAGKHVVVAANEELPGEALKALGAPYAPTDSERERGLEWLAGRYGFPKEALAHYSVEDLAVERSVLSLLE